MAVFDVIVAHFGFNIEKHCWHHSTAAIIENSSCNHLACKQTMHGALDTFSFPENISHFHYQAVFIIRSSKVPTLWISVHLDLDYMTNSPTQNAFAMRLYFPASQDGTKRRTCNRLSISILVGTTIKLWNST